MTRLAVVVAIVLPVMLGVLVSGACQPEGVLTEEETAALQELQQRIAELEEEVGGLRAEVAAVNEQLSSANDMIGALEGTGGERVEAIVKLQNEVTAKEHEVLQLSSQLADKASEIEELEAEIATLQQLLADERASGPGPRPRVIGRDIWHGDPFLLRPLVEYAEGEGWRGVDIHVQPLTYEYLTGEEVSILYIAGTGTAYSEGEIEEIRRFVETGGGLLIHADPRRDYHTYEVLSIFGVSVAETGHGSQGELDVAVESTHPLMANVNVVRLKPTYEAAGVWFSGAVALELDYPAYSILRAGTAEPYAPFVAAAEVGMGRVVIVPHRLEVDDADNATFYRNALYWLQQEDP